MDAKPDAALNPDPAMAEVLATALLQSLFQYLRLTETHDIKNSIFEPVMRDLLRTQASFLEGTGQSDLELSFRGEHIFINKVKLRPRPRQFHIYRFVLKFMRIRRVGAMYLKRGSSLDQMRDFLWMISRSIEIPRDQTEPAVQMMGMLKERGLDAFFGVSPITKLYSGSNAGGAGADSDQGLANVELASLAAYDSLRGFLEILLENLERSERFGLRPLSELMQDLLSLAQEDVVQMMRLISVKRYDRPASYKGVNAAFLMIAWADSLKLPKGVIRELAEIALIHPLVLQITEGKIQRLSTRQNAELLALLDRIKSVFPLTGLQILSLSEWLIPFNESGVYSVEGTQCYQHFFSRMLRIVATFEEMTTYEKSKRVYLPDEALAEMLKQSQSFDPTLLKIFINWLGVYPLGSLVELNTGEVAQVFAGASDPLRFQRPIVLILKSSDGALLDRPQIFDLSEMNEKLGTYRKSIKRSTDFEAAGLDLEKLRSRLIAF